MTLNPLLPGGMYVHAMACLDYIPSGMCICAMDPPVWSYCACYGADTIFWQQDPGHCEYSFCIGNPPSGIELKSWIRLFDWMNISNGRKIYLTSPHSFVTCKIFWKYQYGDHAYLATQRSVHDCSHEYSPSYLWFPKPVKLWVKMGKIKHELDQAFTALRHFVMELMSPAYISLHCH